MYLFHMNADEDTMADTTEAYNATTAEIEDDLVDTALEAIQGRKDIEALTRLALVAAGALETRGMRATGMRLRELSARIQRTIGIH